MEDAASAVFSRKSLISGYRRMACLPASKRLIHHPGFTKDIPVTLFMKRYRIALTLLLNCAALVI
jgi:hypothetical protein